MSEAQRSPPPPAMSRDYERQLRDVNDALLVSSVRQHELIELARRSEAALGESEEQFRRVVEDAPIPTIMQAEDGEVLKISKTWTELTGYRNEEMSTFDSWLGSAYGVGAEAMRRRVKDLFRDAAGMVQVEFEIMTRSRGKRVWAFSASSPGTLRDGRRFLVGMAVDVTERNAAEEHTNMLMREVNHRAKNLLAVVQAVARLTAKGEAQRAFAEHFSARLAGLAASHDLLVQSAWRGVDVGDLVRSQLSHFRHLIGARISLDGPPIRLSSVAAQSIGLALHELATNAGKYGALSNEEGSVTVSWAMTEADGPPRYAMSWRERDGPAVHPPERKGFGQTVIVATVQHGLDAEVILDYAASGLVWRMSSPAATTLDRQGGVT